MKLVDITKLFMYSRQLEKETLSRKAYRKDFHELCNASKGAILVHLEVGATQEKQSQY